MTRGVAVGNGPVVAVGGGGAGGRIAVGTGVGANVGGGNRQPSAFPYVGRGLAKTLRRKPQSDGNA